MKLKLNRKEIEIIKADSFSERLFGLMGKENFDYGMYFPKCKSIHTFFMKESINVFGLDDEYKVVFRKIDLKPNKILDIKQKKTNILELPSNIGRNIKIGDKLTIC